MGPEEAVTASVMSVFGSRIRALLPVRDQESVDVEGRPPSKQDTV